MKKFFLLVCAVAVAGGASYWFLFREEPAKEATGPRRGGGAVPVVAATVESRNVPVTVETIGSIEPLSTVGVKSRVDGQMMEAFITEGQFVRKGDPLFTIDPRPFRAKVAEAEANLAKDKALLDNARGDYARYSKLAQGGFSSAQKYDQAKAAAAVLEAAMQVNLAQLERAKLDLEFTSIRAPVDGRLGSVLVDPGNLVKANDSTLVVINQVRPINVAFSVPERHLPEIKAQMAKSALSVDSFLPGAAATPLRGRVVFVNNAVDTATGTIQLKAQLANDRDELTPGQFVRVSLILHELPGALVVPSQAVQNGQMGTFVYRISPEKRATIAKVKLGPQTANGGIVISDGLKAGDVVVTEGQLRLRPGAPVSVAGAGDGNRTGKRPGVKPGEGGKGPGAGKPGKPAGEADGGAPGRTGTKPTKAADAAPAARSE